MCLVKSYVLLSLLIFRMNLTVSVPNHCLSIYFYFQLFYLLKIYSLVGNIKNDLVKYFMQHIRNDLIIDLINSRKNNIC